MQRFKQFLQENDTLRFSAFLISRTSMPQINNVNDFVNFLDHQGVDATHNNTTVDHLNPTQTDFDQQKVDRIVSDWADGGASDVKPIIISDDGFVADGHHRYYAALQSNTPINVIVVMLPINKLLKAMYDYTELRNG